MTDVITSLGAMERLPMLEEGLMNILHQLNISQQQATIPSPELVPEISHVALAVEVIDRGKAVLEEKPIVKGETTDLPYAPNRQETLP